MTTESHKTEPQELFAFWEYDLFPYLLGGRVLHFTKNGRVQVEGFDRYEFVPVAVVPIQTGVNISNAMKQLLGAYESEQKQLLKNARASMARVFEIHDVEIPKVLK